MTLERMLRLNLTAWVVLLFAPTGCSDSSGSDSRLGAVVATDAGDAADSRGPANETSVPVSDGRGGAPPTSDAHGGAPGTGGSTLDASNPPPTDANIDSGLAPEQCPVLNDGCPAGCTAIAGYRDDLQRSCRVADPLVACSRRSIFGDAETCRVRISDGAVYYFTTSVLGPPYYEGWRACTSAERQAAFRITTPCP